MQDLSQTTDNMHLSSVPTWEARQDRVNVQTRYLAKSNQAYIMQWWRFPTECDIASDAIIHDI